MHVTVCTDGWTDVRSRKKSVDSKGGATDACKSEMTKAKTLGIGKLTK